MALLVRKQYFSFQEFFNPIEEKELHTIDNFIKHLSKNKRAYNTVVVFLAFILFNTNISFALSAETKFFNAINKVENIGFLIIIGRGLIEFGRCVLAGDVEGAKRKFFEYGFLVALLKAFIPTMKWIGSLFE